MAAPISALAGQERANLELFSETLFRGLATRLQSKGSIQMLLNLDFVVPDFPSGFMEYVESNKVHVLGICYGLQLIVQKTGGEVRVGEKQEYGRMEIEVEKACGLFGNKKVGDRQSVWMSHGDEAVKLQEGFEVVARSKQGSVAAVENREKRLYGLQYHPEVTHSPEGMETLRYFLFDICGVTAGWKMFLRKN